METEDNRGAMTEGTPQRTIEGSQRHADAEDEISLIDLLVVLLRRRRLIAAATLAAVIFAAAYAFLSPGFQKSENKTPVAALVTIQLDLVPVVSPPALGAAFRVDLGILAMNYLNDADFLAVVPGPSFPLTVKSEKKGDASTVSLSLRAENADRGLAYVLSAVALLDERLKNDLPDPAFREADFPVLAVANKMITPDTPPDAFKDAVKTSIIIVFAVFFMSVFLAFVLEYVARVREDAESMTKIRQALK